MRRLQTALLSAAALVLGGGGAHAACSLGDFSAIASGVTYDPFDVMAPIAAITIRATTSGDCRSARAQLALVSTPQSPRTGTAIELSAGAGVLQASVLDVGGGPRQVASAANTAFIDQPPFLPLGSQGLQGPGASLRLALPAGQPVAPGTYAAHLLLVARVSDEHGTVNEAQTPLDLSVYVKPSVRLAAGGSDLAIDLGELKSGGVGGAPVRFDAYANLNYELALKSANAFTLARAGGGVGAGPHYTPVVTPSANGRLASDAPDTMHLEFDAPRGDGRRSHTLNVQLAPLGRQPAGAYSDELTLEIRPRV